MTIRVAVAGVTSGLGHAIASGLLECSDIQTILLTRQSSSPSDLSTFTSRGAIIKVVEYSSIPDLVSALAGVETVISAISPYIDSTPTLNLIHAAKTAGVRRFAPSAFAFPPATYSHVDFYASKIQALEVLRESGLEFTSFQNGMFMDYFAFGAPKPHEGPMKILPFAVDIAAKQATIPGTGDEKVTFTSVRDIGRFVAAAVRLTERWPEELGMEGETTTYNQVVRDAEAVTGRKIAVQHLDKAYLTKALNESKDDEATFFYNQVLALLADDLGSVSPTLNTFLPDIRASSVKELIVEYWNV
jgi:nucleoside-diphosphate-sugar epimerase